MNFKLVFLYFYLLEFRYYFYITNGFFYDINAKKINISLALIFCEWVVNHECHFFYMVI